MSTETEAPAGSALIGLVMRGRILEGAQISQDFAVFHWPQCKPPRTEYQGQEYQHLAKDSDMAFEVTWNGSFWNCRADGYGHLKSRGHPGDYGNGSIFVHAFDGVALDSHNA